ncbi:Crp/Fnr family transcriptional regulator [Candidatus Aeolococcus gillhamiae]|uniref:Crp/Fnr family transcriptional regulator n=1 Tax=Candidatus Aeolococcus gillhamiae TaxID=3127015 RepID=A0A2W5Z6Z7_9BACT|nr:MAG: Crp/Fnr family transcriptional regulator [Candidatus Dormibacter sp. RRmetagenome_bin12]
MELSHRPWEPEALDVTLEQGRPEGNSILGALPADDFERLQPKLSLTPLRVKNVLFEPGAPIDVIYFPIDGVVSLVTPLRDGAIVEVATIGNEGIVGVPYFLRGALAVRAIALVKGRALQIKAADFRAEVTSPGPLCDLAQSYAQALFSQVAQTAACNRLHSNEQRLSRWLLMSHDRVGRDTFDITQEFLGQMLGSRRVTVTRSACSLQAAGLIRYHRGHLTIVDRHGLEDAACECYRVIEKELARPLALAT